MDYRLYNTLNEIRSTGKDEERIRKELYALWRECFGDTKSYTDFYFNWKIKDNRVLTVYKQDCLSAMLHLNPYIVMVAGKPEPLNYIVGVATRRQDRRQGLMKMLLETSLNQMYEEHMPFTYLMPAAEAIYLPFGFRIVYEQEPWKQQLLEAVKKGNQEGSYPKHWPKDIKVIALKSGDEEKIAGLTAFTGEHLMKNYDIYTERSPYYYKRLIHEMESAKGEVLLCCLRNEIIGYVSYMTEGGFGIAECIYKPEEKRSFMDAVSRRIGDRNLNGNVNHANPAIMARIVDWRSFIKSVTAKEEVVLNIKIEDSVIHENNGVYRLQFTRFGCQAIITQTQPELAADIADLTRLFFGTLTEKEVTSLIVQGGGNEIIINKMKKINFYKKLFINDVV